MIPQKKGEKSTGNESSSNELKVAQVEQHCTERISVVDYVLMAVSTRGAH